MPSISPNIDITSLSEKLKSSQVPDDLAELILAKASRVLKGAQFSEIESLLSYIDWICFLPWERETQDILDISHAKEALDREHYGLAEIKERILEFISVMKLQKEKDIKTSRAPILCFVGLVGTGKTTIAASIAKALSRKFVRIPFGGLGDPGMLRGTARLHPGSEPGQIIKALRRVEVKNPVILLDEIDRVADNIRTTIMGVLVELLDPEQNNSFVDSYIDYPFDLSHALFITTANNTTNIATAVLDRLEIIQMPSYTDQEKITIGRDYLLPRALEDVGIDKSQITISDPVWPMIVRPLGYDAGTRTLERTIQGIVRKIAKMISEGKPSPFQLNENNIKEYLPSW